MALVIALLAVGLWSLSRSASVTIDAWKCGDTPIIEQSLTAIEGADCGPSVVQAKIEVLVEGQQIEGLDGTDPVSIPRQIEDPSAAMLQVTLEAPATAVILADTREQFGVPGHALRGSADGLVWETSYQPRDSKDLVLLVGPPPDVEFAD